MFGELGPRLKGGFNDFLTALVGTVVTFKPVPGQDLIIAPGDPASPYSNGRAMTVQGGSASPPPGNNASAGALTLQGGSTVNGTPGAVNINGGNATAGAGAAVNIAAGTGSSNGGNVAVSTSAGGAISLTTGNDVSGTNPGAVSITGGSSSSAGLPGPVNITAGSNTASAGFNKSGAAVTITGGNGGATNTAGGAVALASGTGAGTGNGGDITLTPGAGGASGVKGNILTKGGVCDQAYSYQQPATGFSITIGGGIQTLILDPASTLATGTITMPAAPADGQQIRLTSTQTVTALTVSANTGQSITNAPSTIAPNLTGSQGYEYIYRLANTTWYRLQ